VLADLAPEQRPVAERALQGGIPAVRQAIQEQNARLRSEGKEEIPAGGVLSMAEQLLPRLRVAEWLDRAAAAKADLEELDLRDLRSVVAAADDPMVSRDEETRALAAELKQALVTKQEKELQLWFSDIDAAIGVGRVIRALKLSSQPPKAGIRFPAELARKLSEAANASLTADAMSDRWSALLEAVAFSPVRTQVNPTARPENPGDDLVASVTRLAPLLPQIAALFGIDVKDGAQPPKPLRPTRPDKPATKKAVPQPPRPPKDKSERPPRAAPGGEDTPVEETAGDAAADLVGEPALAEPGGDIATIADAPAAAADEIAAAEMSTDATIEAPDDTSDASEAAAEPTSDTPAATTDAPDATTDAPAATTDAADATTDAPDATSDAADATGDAPAATTDAPVAAADSTVDFVTEGPEEGSEPGVAMLAAIDPPAATDFAADGPESGAVEVDSTIGPDAGSDDAAPVAAHDAVGSDSLADDPG
jgi:hypothetical protein